MQASHKIMLILGLTSIVISTRAVVAATHGPTTSPGVISKPTSPAEPQRRLKEVDRTRQEMHERAAQARKKEALAFQQLKSIQHRLAATTTVLNVHEHKLKKTEHRITETQHNLETTHTQAEQLSAQATKRLREIYEGQRLSLLEMMFQVQSLQSLLDLFYYHELVAQADQKLLEELKARAQALNARKQQLGNQKNALGDLISEFARKALQIRGEKETQEQVAQKLKTQRAFYEQAERQLEIESQHLEKQIVDMESSSKRTLKNMQKGSGLLAYPMQAPVTSGFGWRRHPIFGVRKFHSGLDLGGPNHGAVRAADSGNVLYTGWYGGYGRVAIVSHGKGLATLYAHLSNVAVGPGTNVAKGQLVGYEGTTGFSTGPHLHFEVRVNGKPNDPLHFLH